MKERKGPWTLEIGRDSDLVVLVPPPHPSPNNVRFCAHVCVHVITLAIARSSCEERSSQGARGIILPHTRVNKTKQHTDRVINLLI